MGQLGRFVIGVSVLLVAVGVAVGVDVVSVHRTPDNWQEVVWEVEADGLGVDSGLTDEVVSGTLVRTYWAPKTGNTVTTGVVSVRDSWTWAPDVTILSGDLAAGSFTIGPNTEVLTTWPTAKIHFGARLQMDLSSGTGAIGTVGLLVAPELE